MGRIISTIAAISVAFAMSIPAQAEERGTGANPPAEASTPDAAELEQARAIIEIMFPPESRDATFQTLLQQVGQQARAATPVDSFEDAGLKKILTDYLDRMPTEFMPLIRQHLPKMFEAMAVAYGHEFSLDELKSLRAFAESPTGSHYLSRSMAMMGDPAVAEVNREYFAAVQEHLAAQRQEMTAKIKVYLTAHPEAAGSTPPIPGH